MLVTLAGYDIMKGRALLKRTEAGDFAHVILACLFHDIGYVRGILEGDDSDGYVIDAKGGKTSLPVDHLTLRSRHITLTGRSCS